MARKQSWFSTWWGLILSIVAIIIILILITWGLAHIMDSGFGLYVLIFIVVIIILIIMGAIFSEGFRSFLLRLKRRRL